MSIASPGFCGGHAWRSRSRTARKQARSHASRLAHLNPRAASHPESRSRRAADLTSSHVVAARAGSIRDSRSKLANVHSCGGRFWIDSISQSVGGSRGLIVSSRVFRSRRYSARSCDEAMTCASWSPGRGRLRHGHLPATPAGSIQTLTDFLRFIACPVGRPVLAATRSASLLESRPQTQAQQGAAARSRIVGFSTAVAGRPSAAQYVVGHRPRAVK